MAIPRFLLPTLMSLICGGAAMAADPLTFPWQGRLTVNEIPVTGSHSMVFSLLDSSSTELYNSGAITVQVTEGLAAVLVGGGSMPAIPASVANADGLVMHIILDGNTLSSDIPLVPAFRAHAISDGVVSEAKLDSAAAIKLNALATALSTSATLGNGSASDSKVPSQLAVKTYVDNAVANGGGGGGGGATIDTSTTLGNSNLVVPSQLAVKTYVDNGDGTLLTAVANEATARGTAITNEGTTRANADTTLTTAVSTEATTRASADAALNTAITNEASTRATAVAAKLDSSALDTTIDLGTSTSASNAKVPSQLAVKTYVDNAVANSGGGGGGGGVTLDTSPTLGSSNAVAPSQLAVKTYVDNGDAALSTAITNEATARGTAITTEATARTNSDTTLTNAVTAEATARTNADTTLTTAVSAETTARTTADTTLTNAVSAEATARTSADTTLTNAISAETTARTSAVATDALLGSGAPSNALVPSQAAVKSYVDTAVAAVSGGTIADGSVTLIKMADLPTLTLIGNNTGGSHVPVALTVTAVKTLLAIGPADIGVGLSPLATSGAASDLTGTIATAQIADDNVTAAKLVADSVTTVKILDANVTTAKLADDSVTTVKVLNANITTAKLADSSVTSGKMASGLDGRLAWTTTATDPAPMVVNTGYVVTGATTVSLPDVATVGDRLRVIARDGDVQVGPGATSTIINQAAAGNTLVPVLRFHAIELVCVDASLNANIWAVVYTY